MLTDVHEAGVVTLRPRPVAGSVDELLAGAERRAAFRPDDARSGAPFERVWIGGEPHVVKHVHVDHDLAMRAYGDVGCLPLRVWAAGLMDVAADVIDHTVAGVAAGVGRNGWGAAILMRDASADLVPLGNDPVPEAQHLAFLDHIAVLAARMWGWRDDVGLLPYATRWHLLGPAALDAERDLGWPEPLARFATEGWERFAERVPRDVAAGVAALRHDVTPFVTALARTPSTFLHGDWKMGNLGTAADGRTVLLDWTYPGAGPVCHELAWYLGLNRERLPAGHGKEHTIEDFRAALERHGVATGGWWETQLDLCLLGLVLLLGCEKAMGDDAELGWWTDRARAGLARL